jgi:hypothetical protein
LLTSRRDHDVAGWRLLSQGNATKAAAPLDGLLAHLAHPAQLVFVSHVFEFAFFSGCHPPPAAAQVPHDVPGAPAPTGSGVPRGSSKLLEVLCHEEDVGRPKSFDCHAASSTAQIHDSNEDPTV